MNGIWSTTVCPTVHKYDHIVWLRLTGNSLTQALSSHTLIFTIPSDFRPNMDFIGLCYQANAVTETFHLYITSDGNVKSYIGGLPEDWIDFSLTYMTD